MFGKHFAQMYSGSMFGQPAVVFAVWGYVIASLRPSRKDGQCYVELNPSLLAATFATTSSEILEAIGTLCAPDAKSRSKEEEGRRLVHLGGPLIDGPMQFRVVNGAKYRALRDEEERRTYLREAKRKERKSTKSRDVNRRQPRSSQVEEDVDVEVSTEAPPLPPPPEQRAEDATRKTITTLQIDLARLLTALEEHPNSRRRLTDWCREVTSYDKTDGTKVKGRADFRTIQSIDHLEKSISDAQWWLEELEGGRVVGADVLVREAQRGEG